MRPDEEDQDHGGRDGHQGPIQSEQNAHTDRQSAEEL
jgi:hypothetical protein